MQNLPSGARNADISQHDTFAGAPSFALRHRLLRLIWTVVWVALARWTPRPFRRWRVFLLNLFGAEVHATAQVYGSAEIWYPPNLKVGAFSTIGPYVNCYSMARVVLGDHVVISQGAFLCTGTHDIHRSSFQILAKPIHIEDDVWVCAEAFVGPGVRLRAGAVLAARAATFSSLDSWSVYKGNVAIKCGERTQFSRR